MTAAAWTLDASPATRRRVVTALRIYQEATLRCVISAEKPKKEKLSA